MHIAVSNLELLFKSVLKYTNLLEDFYLLNFNMDDLKSFKHFWPDYQSYIGNIAK